MILLSLPLIIVQWVLVTLVLYCLRRVPESVLESIEAVFRRRACEPPNVMVDDATPLSAPLRVAKIIQFRSKWS